MQSIDMDRIKKTIDRQPRQLQQASLQLVKDLQTQYQRYAGKLPVSKQVLNTTYKGQVTVESQVVHETESRVSIDNSIDSYRSQNVKLKEFSFPKNKNDKLREAKYNF
jgi:hypothetical protein